VLIFVTECAMDGVQFPIGPCVLLLVALAAAWDLQTRRIPNWLVATALLIALPVQWMLHGAFGGVQIWLFGVLVGGLTFLPGYAMRMVGAGDVKLTAAVGSFCGALAVVQIAVIACVIGGVWALITLIRHRQVKAGSIKMLTMLGMSQSEVQIDRGPNEEGTRAQVIARLPYGAAIALSTVWVLMASA
jgi:prepilin peptidase CpaA